MVPRNRSLAIACRYMRVVSVRSQAVGLMVILLSLWRPQGLIESCFYIRRSSFDRAVYIL